MKFIGTYLENGAGCVVIFVLQIGFTLGKALAFVSVSKTREILVLAILSLNDNALIVQSSSLGLCPQSGSSAKLQTIILNAEVNGISWVNTVFFFNLLIVLSRSLSRWKWSTSRYAL